MSSTIKDIAKRTNLGLATISKYLNGGNVRDENKKAIDEAVLALDFKINALARGLRTHKSNTIGIVIPEFNNLFFTSIITVMEDILRKHDYGILVCDSRSDPKIETEAINFLIDKRVDGIVIMPVQHNVDCLKSVLENKLPIVVLDRFIEEIADQVDSVVVDNFDASFSSMQELLKNGHREIGIIVGPFDIFTSKQRLLGYEDALQKAGVKRQNSLIEYSDYSTEGGYKSTIKLINNNPNMTALFVTNYEMTLGCILALNELDVVIPDQLSIIGFDNLQLSKIVKPRLTIVDQPLEDIGKYAAKLLLDKLKNGDMPVETIVLKTHLEHGQSVKNLNK